MDALCGGIEDDSGAWQPSQEQDESAETVLLRKTVSQRTGSTTAELATSGAASIRYPPSPRAEAS
jgi:hypothetical protein